MLLTKKHLIKKSLMLAVLLIGGTSHVNAKPLNVTQSVSGPAGLVLMPSSRMLADGEFSITYSSYYPYSQYVITAQPLPWLQALFKYTDIATRSYVVSTTGQSLKDKSTDIKVRLLEEGYFSPEVSLGINDVGGTGLFASEYIVASKQYKNMDFSLGLGWGYLGKQGHFTNPFTYLSDSFKTREVSGTVGGEFNTLSFFSGEKVAVFLGGEYQFESIPLTLKAEYDANNYQADPGGDLEQTIPLNFGLVYSPFKYVDIHAGVVRGNTAMLGVTLRTNLKSNGPAKHFDPEPMAVNELSKADRNWSVVTKKLKENAGLKVKTITQDDNRLIVEAAPKYFMETAQGVGRAARILTNQELRGVDKLVFVEEFNGAELSAIELDRSTLEKAARLEIESEEVIESTRFLPKSEVDSQKSKVLYQAKRKEFDYSFKPNFSGSYGGPDAFLLYQFGIVANANYYLRENTWLRGAVELGLIDNYEEFNYTAPSNLPRVRTNIKEYMKTSKLRLSSLQLLDFESFGEDLYGLAYIGYLESMYGGVGAELMYRPHGEKWALGLDANYVKQREFDVRFDFRDYSVATGHLTGYYETDDHMLFKLSAGRYLAKDVGVSIDVSRKFRSGAKLGFWATKTNVSAEDFGEGSFDKGFYFSFPMNLFTLKSTRDTARFNWQFLTRDGGQKLKKVYDLYEITDSRSLGFIEDSFENVLR